MNLKGKRAQIKRTPVKQLL